MTIAIPSVDRKVATQLVLTQTNISIIDLESRPVPRPLDMGRLVKIDIGGTIIIVAIKDLIAAVTCLNS